MTMGVSLDLSIGAYRVWQRNRDTFYRLWKTESWPPIVEPIFNLIAIGFGIGAYISGIEGAQSYVQFVTPGIIAQSMMFAASFECLFGSFIRMDFQRTFDAITSTPVSIDDVALGEVLWGATRGTIAAAGVMLAAAALGLLSWPSAIFILPLAFLAAFAFAAIALSVTAVVPSINAFNYYFTLFITPMFLFSEVLFPTDRLPPPFRELTLFSPLTHFVRPARALATGQFESGHLMHVAVLAAIAAIGMVLSIQLMRRRLIK